MRPLFESNLSAHLLQSQKHSVIKKFKITLHLWLSVLHRVNGLLAEYHLVLYFSMLTLVQEHIKNVSEKSLWSCVKKILLWLEEHVLQSSASSQLSWKNKTLLLNCYQSSDNLHKTNKMQFVFFVLNRLFSWPVTSQKKRIKFTPLEHFLLQVKINHGKCVFALLKVLQSLLRLLEKKFLIITLYRHSRYYWMITSLKLKMLLLQVYHWV